MNKKFELENMEYFENIGIEEDVDFELYLTKKEIKQFLKKGTGALLSLNATKGMWYSKEKKRLYFFRCEENDNTLDYSETLTQDEMEFENYVDFINVKSTEEAKSQLRAGKGVITSEDKKEGLFFSNELCKLFRFGTDEDESIDEVDEGEIFGSEISIEEADEILNKLSETLAEDIKKKEEIDNWFEL